MKRLATYDPATIGIVTTAISAVQTIGGVIQGIGATAQNGGVEANQSRLMRQAEEQLQGLVNSVNRNEYNAAASRDIAQAARTIAQQMSDRGLSSGTSALSAMSDAAAGIQSQYSQKYLTDRQSALQAQASGSYNIGSFKPLGYNDDPFAGVFDGLQGILGGLSAAGKPSTGGLNPVTPGMPKPSELANIPRF